MNGTISFMSEQDFGTIEDGFGSCWARCKEDCGLVVVRPGKVQCDECDSKCNHCGGEIKYYSDTESPYERMSGYMCLTCMDEYGFRRKE